MVLYLIKSRSDLARVELLQQEKGGNVSESWREECWQEFVVLAYRKHSITVQQYCSPSIESKVMAEYFADIDNMDEVCATCFRVCRLKRPPRGYIADDSQLMVEMLWTKMMGK